MRQLKYILPLITTLLLTSLFACSSKGAEEGNKEASKIDVGAIVIDHLADSYEWHITSWGDKHLTINLPVIVKGEKDGWQVFSSKRITHGESYNGFYISTSGFTDGKIVELNDAGEEVRPWDFSITKTALGLFINSFLLVVIILSTARWYKKHTHLDGAPKGAIGVMELLILSLYDDLIKPVIGEKYKRYTPYLLTAFFFIFLNNLMGLVPIFPGGSNVTGNISITFVLAMFTFAMINLFGNKEYWKEIFWPDVPTWLKAPIPLLPLIEVISMFTKPFALMIRLFANLLAGHAIILSLTAVIFVTASIGPAIGTPMTLMSIVFMVFMNLLEILVAFIQAYVFTMLSAVFIGLSQPKAHVPKKIAIEEA